MEKERGLPGRTEGAYEVIHVKKRLPSRAVLFFVFQITLVTHKDCSMSGHCRLSLYSLYSLLHA